MKDEGRKVVYVLDLLHLIEKKLGDERIKNMTIEQILELRDDTLALIEKEITPRDFERRWKI